MKKYRPETFSNHRFRDLVEEFIQGDRDRAILIRCYVDDRSISELEQEFHLSESQIKRIVHKGGHKIFRMMEAELPKYEL